MYKRQVVENRAPFRALSAQGCFKQIPYIIQCFRAGKMCIRDSVCTDENDDWLNIYANYDIAEDRPCDTLELTLCKGDGSEESWSYQLNAAEQDLSLIHI